jgi:hypothetical protein
MLFLKFKPRKISINYYNTTGKLLNHVLMISRHFPTAIFMEVFVSHKQNDVTAPIKKKHLLSD